MSRDSLEALQRFQEGVRDPAEVASFFRSNVSLALPEGSPHGPLKLRFVPPRPGTTPLGIELIPQVCFGRRSGGWACYTEQELSGLDLEAEDDLDTSRVKWFYSTTSGDDIGQRLVNLLKSKGIAISDNPTPITDLPSGEGVIETDVVALFDSVLARAIGKIAFNYLVWVTYPDDPAFPFRSEFDSIRGFIRNGVGSARDYVRVDDKPILMGDGERARRTNGHLVNVAWERWPGGGVVSRVSLFNYTTYTVRLAERMSGVWRNIKSGHHWNFVSGRVERLASGGSFIKPGRAFQLP